MLEAKLDELADILEDVHKDLEKYSTEVLNNRHREQILDLDDMITRLAQLEDMLGKAQLCLIDLRRVLTFLSRPRALGSHIYDADIRELSEDVRSLVEHDAFLFQKSDSCWIPRPDSLTLNRMIRFVASRFYRVCLRHPC